MHLRIIGLGLFVAAVAGTQALGSYQVFFGDHYANWPGYSGKSQDENGVPIFPGTPSTAPAANNKAGVVTLDQTGNQLLSILFNYERGDLLHNLWPHLRPGDLMLDTDDVEGWDYIIRSPVAPVSYYSAGTDNILADGPWSVYHFNTDIPLELDTDDPQYMLAKDSRTRSGGPWPGSVRGDHPWAIDGGWLSGELASGDAQLVGTVYFSGWQDPDAFTHESTDGTDNNAGVSMFDFTIGSLPDLYLDRLTFAFTVSCANDVLYESIPLRTPTGDVPEPASLLVWAVLGLSFAGGSWRLAFRRRRWTHWDTEE